MFSATVKKIMAMAGLFSALAMTACAPNGSLQAKSGGGLVGVIPQSYASSCSGSGFIYNESLDGASYSATAFQQRAQDFVSATLSPSALGTLNGGKSVDGGNYISVTGTLAFDSSGNLLTTQTNIDIEINDSYVGTTTGDGHSIEAYPVIFNPATSSGSETASGRVDRNAKTFTVTFQDSYGTVTLSGKYNGSQVTGRVDFANTQNVDSSQGPKSGVLGAFNLSNCTL